MEITGSCLFFFSILSACAVMRIIYEQVKNITYQGTWLVQIVALLCAGMMTQFMTNSYSLSILIAAICFLIISMARNLLGDFTCGGQLLIMATIMLSISFVVHSAFLLPLFLDGGSEFFIFLLLSFAIFITPVGLLEMWKNWLPLITKAWRRPNSSLPPTRRDFYPKVSIHVPTYSEPPDIVIETLDALANLDYPNYEVLVVDNNTEDEALWIPVRNHCETLGEAFRFFHVHPLQGHKAGALNYALSHTSKDVEIIGVVDADYVVDSRWIRALVDYFDDESIGFVQPPHAYREHETSLFSTACNWEYKWLYLTAQKTQNEYNSGVTVGTMCLIRRKALKEVGGWAEWCLTEDSELSIRLHNQGFSSVNVNDVLGRGLVPDTFEKYKKQRSRWIYGPIQECKRHFHLLLPNGLSVKPGILLSPLQKLYHFSHGLSQVYHLLIYIVDVLVVAIMFSMAINHESHPFPHELLIIAPLLQSIAGIHFWLIYRKENARFSELLGAFMASAALMNVKAMSAFHALISREKPWIRTNKFKTVSRSLSSIMRACYIESFLGVALTISSLSILFLHIFLYRSRLNMLHYFALNVLFIGIAHLSSPMMAFLAEAEKRNSLTHKCSYKDPSENNFRSCRIAKSGKDGWIWQSSLSNVGSNTFTNPKN